MRSEINLLADEIGEQESEHDRLKERLRKGDPSAQAQIEDVRSTIKNLCSERSQKRAQLNAVRRKLQASKRSSSSSSRRPNYSV